MRTFILALAAVLPAVAHADCTVDPAGGANFTTLQGAINNCPTSQMPIVLLDNVGEEVIVNRAVEIDGGGFTVTGNQTGSVFDVRSGTTSITDATITSGDAVAGGGMRIAVGASAVLNNVNVVDNWADNGGGIATEGALTLIDSRVQGNRARDNGGGIAAHVSASPPVVSLTGTDVADNHAGEDGGGIFAIETALFVSASSTVRDNTADGNGGGIHSEGVSGAPSVTVTDSLLVRNDAGANGGGLSITKGPLTLTRSAVSSNMSGAEGGGIFMDSTGGFTATNSTIGSNVALTAGGLSLANLSSGTLQLVTVADNVADTTDQLKSTSTLQVAGSAFGETGGNNGRADCAVVGGTVRFTVSFDGTCVSAHASNTTAALGLQPLGDSFEPAFGSVLNDFVPAAFCTATDELGNARTPFPCDGGSIEN